MMYIEHSPSEENLLNNILKRVPTQSASSAYLVDEHEAATPAFSVKKKIHNHQSSNSAGTIYTNGHINGGYSKQRLEDIVNRSIEFPRFPPLQRHGIAEYKLQQQLKPQTSENIDYQQYLLEEDTEEKNSKQPKVKKDQDLNELNQEEAGEEEEQEDVQNYTLIDIVDSDEEEEEEKNFKDQEQEVEVQTTVEDFIRKHLNGGAKNSNNNKNNNIQKPLCSKPTTTTATIELNEHNSKLNDIGKKNLPETVYKIINVDSTCGEESEFEYQIIKQNKKRKLSQTRLLNGQNSETLSTFPYNPLERYSKSTKNKHQKYYLPAKQRLINSHLTNGVRGIKRKSSTAPHKFLRSNRRRKYSSSAYDFGETYSSDSENEEDLYKEAISSALQAVAETIYKKGKSDSQMGFDIISKIKDFFSFNKSNKDQPERLPKRKRRSTQCSSEEETIPHIKYRRVENNFPKYVEVSSEDDLTTIPCSNKSPLATSKRMTDQKIKLRKSLFDQPKTTRKLVKNTVYADIEFSDDDEIELGHQANTKQHLLKNITFKRPFALPKYKSTGTNTIITKPFDMGGTISNSLLPTSSSLTYAEVTKNAVKANNLSGNNKLSQINNNKHKTSFEAPILGAVVPNKSLSLKLKDLNKETTGLLNGLKTFSIRPLALKRHTMLDQQKQMEDHKNYLELLQGLLPSTYGNENIVPAAKKNLVTSPKNAKHKSTVTSGVENLTNSHGNATLTARVRQPLCSTINLLDDDDEVEFTGFVASSSLRKNSTMNYRKRELSMKLKKTTIPSDDNDTDDNEVSEIIDLDDAKSVQAKTHGTSKTSEQLNRILVSPVNTLFERIHTSAAVNDSWIDDVKSKYLSKKQSRDEELREYEQLTSKLEADRQNAEVELHQRLKSFQIFDPDCVVVDDFPESEEEEEEEPKLISLTAEHHAIIKEALHGPPNEVLVSKFNLNITRRDIYTLQGLNWLNDEVINFYMNLLTERSEKKSKSHGLPTVYAMNTFFVSRLLQNGYAGVKRWTRKVDIFSKDLLPVPVHVGGVHWCMAIINLKKSSIKYYDSMGTPNPTVLRALEQYLKDESLDKRKQSFDTSNFEIVSVDDVPRQMNGSDCGVFSCMFAEFITRNCEITFSQQHMEYFRTKMLLEIVQGELLQ